MFNVGREIVNNQDSHIKKLNQIFLRWIVVTSSSREMMHMASHQICK